MKPFKLLLSLALVVSFFPSSMSQQAHASENEGATLEEECLKDSTLDTSNFTKLELASESESSEASLQEGIPANTKLDFEMYVIPKITYTSYYVPIYVKTKLTTNFHLSVRDVQGRSDGLQELARVNTADIVNEWDDVNGGYKLQNADGRIFGIAFEYTGEKRVQVIDDTQGSRGTVLAEFKLYIDKNSEEEQAAFIDSLIESQTNSSMDSFEKMSAIQKYLGPKMKYLKGYTDSNGNYAGYCKLLEENYCNPWWVSFVGDSYDTPAILCKIAERVGGFSDVHNCYWDYPVGSSSWASTHAYCKCTGVDKNGQEKSICYSICPSEKSNLVAAKDASEIPKNDFSDLSRYQKLTQTAAYYWLNFESNGGSEVTSRIVSSDTTLHSVPNSSKDGYTFEGWFTDPQLTQPAITEKGLTLTNDTTLYAKWSTKKYKVTFNSNGGSSVEEQNIEYGKTVTKPFNPTKDGYTFVNWCSDSALTTVYNFDTAVTGNKTLYAKWQQNATPTPTPTPAPTPTPTPTPQPETITYKVQFNSNGGSSVSAQTVESGKTATRPSNPTKEGYTFVNWYSDSSLKTVYNFGTPITANKTLYAKWEKKTSTATSEDVTLYRLYNKWSGEHLFTKDADEYKTLGEKGWTQEGAAWKSPAMSAAPVYRLYNQYSGDHHYTTNTKEYDDCGKAGWTQEGIAWYSDTGKEKAVYRLFNPYANTGSHHYTTSQKEYGDLAKVGWKQEGEGWYGLT